MRLRSPLSLLVLALVLVAGCGGDDGGGAATGTESAATIAPANTQLFVSVDTDFDSAQWSRAEELLDRFPGKARLLELITQGLAEEDVDFERDVRPALGPTVEIVVLDFEEEGVIALTKPRDQQKFEALLAKADEPLATRKIQGWTAAAQNDAALDRLEQAAGGETLAESDRFSNAMERLPDEALMKLYVNGERATEALDELQSGTIPERFGRLDVAAIALEAEEGGVRLPGFARVEGAEVEPPDVGALLEEVPAGAYAFLNFHGYDGKLQLTDQLRSAPELQGVLGQAERLLGVSLDDLSTLFNQEGLIYVRPGALIPEVTLMLEVDDERQALATVDRLAQRATQIGGAAPQPRAIGDVKAKQLSFGQFSLFYAAFDGRLVVTTQADGIADLAAGGDKLVDEDRYQDALDEAGVENDEDVYFYFDLQQTIAIAEQLAQLADEPLPSEVRANLEPLGVLIGSAKFGKEESTFRLFLQIE